MKYLMLINIFLSTACFAQTYDIGSGGGAALALDDINTGGRVIEDIHTGGRTIELLQLRRISGTSKLELKDARPSIKKLVNRNMRPDTAAKLLNIKIMADLNSISEITLKDGTVLNIQEILKSE